MTQWSYQVSPAPSSTGATSETAVPIERLAFKDLAIDWATGDLSVPIRFVEGVDAIVQNLRIRLRFMLGEWFLDQRLGIPYIEQIFVSSPDVPLVDALLKRAILTTPGIAAVPVFQSRFESAERRYYVDRFEAKLIDGSVLSIVNSPLLLDLGSP